eukprot:4823125-Amphidinium_carterae.1
MNMTTTEVIVTLATETPHSNKIRATIQTQGPELFEKVMQMITMIKTSVLKDLGSSSNSSSSSSNNTTLVSIKMFDGDEITVKKAKRS